VPTAAKMLSFIHVMYRNTGRYFCPFYNLSPKSNVMWW